MLDQSYTPGSRGVLPLSALFQILEPETVARMYFDFRRAEDLDSGDWAAFIGELADAIRTTWTSQEAYIFRARARHLLRFEVLEFGDLDDEAMAAAEELAA